MKTTTKTNLGQKHILIVAFLLIAIFVAAAFSMNTTLKVWAIEGENREETPLYIPTLEDDFKDDRINVVLKQQYSGIDNDITIKNFEINNSKIYLGTIADLSRSNSKNSKLVDGKFFQILSIELAVKGKDKVLEAIEELKKSEIVQFAEPDYNYVAVPLWTPNDIHYGHGDQWGLNGTNGVQAEAAWNITKGNTNIKIGVMEPNGVANHSDLNISRPSGSYNPTGVDQSHGTHVAGIIGAISNNSTGIAGVAQTSIVPLDANNLPASLQYAADNGIWITNASFGYLTVDTNGVPTGHSPANNTHAAAIYNYGIKGGLFVGAAGNGLFSTSTPQNTDNIPCYPAAYSNYTIPAGTYSGIVISKAVAMTNVISVGAINQNGTRSAYSNYGINSVSIYAPGGSWDLNNPEAMILSTYPANLCSSSTVTLDVNGVPTMFYLCEVNNLGVNGYSLKGHRHHAEGYHYMSGTSMAAPHVSGVAALMLSANSNLTAAQLKTAIINNGDTITISTPNGNQAVRRLNAFGAVSSETFITTTLSNNNIRIDGIVQNLKANISGSLNIPNMINGRIVTEIADSAFAGVPCTVIEIPSNVTSLSANSFDNCNNLTAINVATANANYSSTSGVLYNKDRTTLIRYPIKKTGTSFAVPSTVINIGASAFKNQTILTSVTIPASVANVGNSAFMDCTNLTTASLVSSGNLTNVANQTTSYTNYYYTDIKMNANLEAGATYTLSFDYRNLSANTDLTNVFTSLGVGNNTFAVDLPVQKLFSSSSSGHQVITFTPTAAQLATSSMLWCRFIRTSTPQNVSIYISNVTLHKGIASMSLNSFTGCNKLATLGLSYRLLSNNTYAVYGGGTINTNTLFIPSVYNNLTVSTIDPSCFANNKSIRWVFMQSGLTTIGNRAFQFCNNLLNVDMSRTSVTSIEEYTFDICGGTNHVHNPNSPYSGVCALESINYPPNLISIGEGAFIRTGTPKALPNSVTTIGNYAFAYAPHRLGLYLSNNLVSIGAYAFAYNESFILTNENTQLKTIGAHAFEGTILGANSQLPAALTTIGEYAFKDSAFMSNFAFMNNSKLTTIGAYAFENVTSFTDLVIPSTVNNLSAGVATIGANAFKGCTSLTIYTGWTSKPNGWDANWNSSGRPVVWGCTIAADDNYYVKSVLKPNSFTYSSAIARPSRRDYAFGGWYTTSDFSGTQYMDLSAVPSNFSGTLYAKWNTPSCVAEGTLITLADGSQKAVEELTGEEMLLVWNLFTGTFDVAPILFIDSDPAQNYEIIKLSFSDGTEVKVISEHAFWDFNLNEYVFLRNDATEYIGHWFNKQAYDANGNMIWTAVELTDVDIYTEYTTAWSPVTFGHLCYYVNGMLSMPGATTGLINIFEVESNTMQINQEAFLADIETYGLFTYEEFAEIAPIPEIVFEAFGGQYLKVSMGKGLITWQEINALLERYAPFFETDDTDIDTSPSVTDGNNGNHYGQLKNGNNGNSNNDNNGNNGNGNSNNGNGNNGNGNPKNGNHCGQLKKDK